MIWYILASDLISGKMGLNKVKIVCQMKKLIKIFSHLPITIICTHRVSVIAIREFAPKRVCQQSTLCNDCLINVYMAICTYRVSVLGMRDCAFITFF